MTDEEIIYTIALSRVPKINSAYQQILLKELGSATEVFRQRNNIAGILESASPKLTEAIKKIDMYLKRAEEELDFARRNGIRCLCFNDNDYPYRLKECEDSPIIIYYKGNADLNRQHIISVVGTRQCSEYGKDICQRIMHDFKKLRPDILVVSGLAYGVDINAHKSALLNGLDTVGVLAHGLDQIYPRMHRDTACEMIRHGGLITEFMSGSNADKINFIRRNRIVAGISDATIVIESAEKGGALITAELAEGYNRDVFAFPGRINDPHSKGCNNLIKENKAALIESAEDIMSLMKWKKDENHKTEVQLELFPNLSDEETKIVDYLTGKDYSNINNISSETGIPIYKLSTMLLNLEMKGFVKMLNNNNYKVKSI